MTDAREMSKQPFPIIELRQQDWIPGFAAFMAGSGNPGPAHIVLNIGALVAATATGDLKPGELAEVVADCVMHEVFHVIEQWAGAEFSEDRVEDLIERYRAAASRGEQ